MMIYFTVKTQRIASRTGFTLLEVVVAAGIFALILIGIIGILIQISRASVKAREIQNLQDNFRYTFEAMSREIRTGYAYQLSNPRGTSPQTYGTITFTRQDGASVAYCLLTNAVAKATNPSGSGAANCASGIAVTSTDLVVDQLAFYGVGLTAGIGDGQPRITAIMVAHALNPKLNTRMEAQTTVTQRLRDL
jgi:type II secretory pathway pseudopilin PulG